jgi:hypothetical protein
MEEDDLELWTVSHLLHLKELIVRTDMKGPEQDRGLTESTNTAIHFASAYILQR